jgi:protein-S-isoprenylcysteine O-methyltransferase Ste14
MDGIVAWLSGVGSWAWQVSFSLAVVLNFVAVLAVVATRDRRLVDRWTGPWLAANCGLVAFGAGIPAVTWCFRTALAALPTFSLLK